MFNVLAQFLLDRYEGRTRKDGIDFLVDVTGIRQCNRARKITKSKAGDLRVLKSLGTAPLRSL